MLYVHFTVTYFPFDGATLLFPNYVFDKILSKHILCFGNLLYNNYCTTILHNFILQICCATILYNNIVQFIVQYCCTTLLYNNVVQLCCKCDMALTVVPVVRDAVILDNRINYIILNFIKFNLINTNLLMN